MSANKKPFKTGEFGRIIAATACEWLAVNNESSELFQAHMTTFAAEMGCPGLSAQELHQRLQSSIGKWNQEEVKMARFFDWPSKFRHYVKFWTFMRMVHEFWKDTHGDGEKHDDVDMPEEGQADGEESSAAPSKQSLGDKRGTDLVKALKDMQKSRHTLSIVTEILQDSSVKKYATMILHAQQPFATEYRNVLKMLHDTDDPHACRRLQVGWANRSWAQELWNILGVCSDMEALEEMNLLEQDDFQEQDATLLGQLLIRAASQRGWTMAIYSEIPPEQWSGIASADQVAGRAAFQRMKTDAKVVKEAFQAWSSLDPSHPDKPALGVTLQNLWVHKLTVVQDTQQIQRFQLVSTFLRLLQNTPEKHQARSFCRQCHAAPLTLIVQAHDF